MLVATQNFTHLELCIFAELQSSELDIDSEVEIFGTANTWLKPNSEERSS